MRDITTAVPQPGVEAPNDAVVDGSYMTRLRLSGGPRKRKRTENSSVQATLIPKQQPQSKRQKLSDSATAFFPPEFWDSLSNISLTKNALRELDRRSRKSTSTSRRSPYRAAHRPVTRGVLAKLKKRNWLPTQNAQEFLHCCTLGQLKAVRLFAKHGGPDLSDLRGYPDPLYPLHHMMSLSQSSKKRGSASASASLPAPSTATTNTGTPKTSSTSPYDRNFSHNLTKSKVYPDEYEYPDGRIPPYPSNWDEINQRLAKPRASLSPSKFSDEDYRRFKRANAHAFKEKQVSEYVIPKFESEIDNVNCRSGGIPFRNLAPLTDFNLVPGNPDIYYGARPEELDQQVCDELSKQIIPTTEHDLPVAPNFFLHAKGPGGLLDVAERQARYDGALGARGMHSLQSYRQDQPMYDSNAYTISSTYHGGTLKMYTHYAAQPEGSGTRPEYYMHQLRSFAMTDTPDSFRQGATAFRNARDWTKEQRDTAIANANEQAKEAITVEEEDEDEEEEEGEDEGEEEEEEEEEEEAESFSTMFSFTGDQQDRNHESETSMDELAQDYPPRRRKRRY